MTKTKQRLKESQEALEPRIKENKLSSHGLEDSRNSQVLAELN